MRSLLGCPLGGIRIGWALALALFGSLTAGGGHVAAQAVVESAIEADLSTDQRNALYTSLSNEVDELERHRRILKTIVKLVSPTVVHIELKSTKRRPRATAVAGWSKKQAPAS